MCSANGNINIKCKRAPVILHQYHKVANCVKCNQAHSTRLKSIHRLQCLGSDGIPFCFIHKSSHRKQVTPHSLPPGPRCQLKQSKGP